METPYNIETYLLLTPVLFRIGFGIHSVSAFTLFLHFFKQCLLPSFESTIITFVVLFLSRISGSSWCRGFSPALFQCLLLLAIRVSTLESKLLLTSNVAHSCSWIESRLRFPSGGIQNLECQLYCVTIIILPLLLLNSFCLYRTLLYFPLLFTLCQSFYPQTRHEHQKWSTPWET